LDFIPRLQGQADDTFFDGLLDEVAIFEYSLTAAEVSLLYNGDRNLDDDGSPELNDDYDIRIVTEYTISIYTVSNMGVPEHVVYTPQLWQFLE